MLSDLEDESVGDSLHLKSVQNGRKVSLELHVDDGTDDLWDLSHVHLLGIGEC